MKPNKHLKELDGLRTRLYDSELKRREEENRSYMMHLENRFLLLNFNLEAGRDTSDNVIEGMHGGWEFPTCQLRGHFLGHWLSATAMRYHAVGDKEIKAKADAIVDELAECQKANGGQWAGPIPEKYLYRIAQGKQVWAPHYTIHKVFMGLLDMYEYAGNETALEIAENFADWFYDWTGRFSREEMNDILDFETGGMLEIWVELFAVTGKEKYKTLMERYYRERLFDPLLRGEDVLTNMHANTTIPEVIGCARAYDVTGDEKWRTIAENYWKLAVTDRGMYATALPALTLPMGFLPIFFPCRRAAAKAGQARKAISSAVTARLCRPTPLSTEDSTTSRRIRSTSASTVTARLPLA